MIVLFLMVLVTVSFLAARVSLLLYLHMPASWLCEAGEEPGEMQLPRNRCPCRLAVLFLMTAGISVLIGISAGSQRTPVSLLQEKSVFLVIVSIILLPAVLSDTDYCIIPDQVCVAACLAGLGRGLLSGLSGMTDAAAGAFLCGGLMLFSSLLSLLFSGREGMGMGDVKLAAACGSLAAASAGTDTWGMAACSVFVCSVIISAAWFSLLLLLRKADYGDARPMGPWIVLSTLIVIAAG